MAMKVNICTLGHTIPCESREHLIGEILYYLAAEASVPAHEFSGGRSQMILPDDLLIRSGAMAHASFTRSSSPSPPAHPCCRRCCRRGRRVSRSGRR